MEGRERGSTGVEVGGGVFGGAKGYGGAVGGRGGAEEDEGVVEIVAGDAEEVGFGGHGDGCRVLCDDSDPFKLSFFFRYPNFCFS